MNLVYDWAGYLSPRVSCSPVVASHQHSEGMRFETFANPNRGLGLFLCSELVTNAREESGGGGGGLQYDRGGDPRRLA